MKDHERFVPTELIPILLTTSRKIRNSVVPVPFFKELLIRLTQQFEQRYHMGSIRQDLQ